MKKMTFLSIAVFICGIISVNAQNIDTVKNIKRCGFDEYLKQQQQIDPTFESRRQALEVATQEWIKNNPNYLENSKAVITVPVVVHIVGAAACSAISDARVKEQIAVLNKDYAGLSTQTMSPFAANLKANTGVQFCLANRTSTGAITSGIERKTNGSTEFALYSSAVKSNASGGLDSWDRTKYMNIWVCRITGNSAAGYAIPPNTPLPTDFGFVSDYRFFGITGATAPYNLGRTTTHELAHCFNIFHIWGYNDSASCSDTDYCGDTPSQSYATYGSPTGVRTDACTTTAPGIMYMNFMDYTDDATMANFTPNQGARMQYILGAGQILNSLSKSYVTVCAGYSVEENNFIQNVNIYPNPTNGELNINFSIANPCDVNVSIYNILGEEIYSFNKNKTSIVNTNVDISNQAAGIYFVKIKTEKQILTQKISLLK